MHAVERADGHHGALERGRHAVETVEAVKGHEKALRTARYIATASSPRKARQEALEARAARGDQRADGLGIGRAEGIDFVRVDRACDEQQVEAGIGGADGVRADAIADGEDATAVDGIADK